MENIEEVNIIKRGRGRPKKDKPVVEKKPKGRPKKYEGGYIKHRYASIHVKRTEYEELLDIKRRYEDLLRSYRQIEGNNNI